MSHPLMWPPSPFTCTIFCAYGFIGSKPYALSASPFSSGWDFPPGPTVSSGVQLCQPLPLRSESPAGGTRAPPPVLPLRPGRQQGRGGCKHGFYRWGRGKEALSVFKLLAASVVSAFVSFRGRQPRDSPRGLCSRRAARCTPPGRSQGLCLSICNITANRHGRRI